MESPGSTHNSTAFQMTEFAKAWLFDTVLYNILGCGRSYWLAGEYAYGAYLCPLSPLPASKNDAIANIILLLSSKNWTLEL